MKKTLTIQNFEQFVAINGCDIRQWPIDENNAVKLFAGTNEGQLILTEELRLNNVLDHIKPPKISDELLDELRTISSGPKMLEIKQGSLNIYHGFFNRLLEEFDTIFGDIKQVYFVGQAAAMAAALFIGITFGMQENPSDTLSDTEVENIDLSQAMFSDVIYDLDGDIEGSDPNENSMEERQ